MARTLDVYLHHHLVGHLTQDNEGQMSFAYAESWLKSTTPPPAPLSRSLPLRQERFTRKECAGFFGGILPEASQREMVAKNLGISARNDFAMLEQIGGECAGAVTFMPAGQPLPARDDKYRELSDKELSDMLKTLPKRPLLAGEKEVRLSLAGAQDKLAVKVSGDKISIPLDGALSTHILKPASAHFAGLVFNEMLCLDLARAAGLPTARAETRNSDGIDYILIERYDRTLVGTGNSRYYDRLHQEDFCQALGIVSERKYQAEGGPSLKQCFDLLRDVSAAPVIDLQRLLDAAIFNFLIGNNDAHAKNFSILYNPVASGFEARFSPLYDLVCTVYYPELSKKMAMKIGGEYLPERISSREFEKLADEAGLATPLVKRRVPELASSVREALKTAPIKDRVTAEVAKLIEQRSSEFLERFGR
jgi:serine/threonine-protein kinase HipA